MFRCVKKSETRITASALKQDPNTYKIDKGDYPENLQIVCLCDNK